MCEMLGVSRSGYYAWAHRPESPRRKRHAQLTQEVARVFWQSRRLYGSPKITEALRRQGIRVSSKTVARIMKKQGFQSRTVRKYKATTNAQHTLPVHENVLNQQFTADAPHQVWMADITYIGTDEGWLYLASILDLCTRKVVGWHVDERMTKELAIQALEKAVQRERPRGEVLHHSDRGSQYASHEYQKRLLAYGMKSSMSRKGNCYDNACVESFHSLLKKELVYQEKFRTREEAKRKLFEYIEIFYNRQRLHSALGYQTPVEYEHTFAKLA